MSDDFLAGQRYVRWVPRVARSLLPSPAIYHVTSRGVNRNDIYLDDEDRRNFISRLVRIAGRWRWKCLAYTLMTNHYHLLVDSTITDLSRGMRSLNGDYAREFNVRHGRIGHLFQGRYEIRVLRDDEHLENACAYIWNNPVAVDLAETIDAWPWSGSV